MAVRPLKFGIVGTAGFLSVLMFTTPTLAQNVAREAQIVVDAQTNEILYENNAQAPRIPASITKVMTLYLLFDALEKGTITWDDRISFSRNAAAQPPTKLFVGAGNSIGIQTAIQALILRSANDVATAVAERLGGSEANFAQMMTRKARELGMSSTTFRNASGLPNAGQRTTAEDLARLAIAIHRDFPDQYHWFSTQQMSYNGQTITGHNHLMGRMAGMDGLKTGYTNASRFNLAATTQRNGRRIVTVVLGGANRFQRDDLVEALTESAFKELGIGGTQFAANITSYDVNFRDARDAADAAALFMDLPLRPVISGGVTTIAMNRSGRRLGFERGAPTFEVADMTRPPLPRVTGGRLTQVAQRDDSETGATDEGEDEVARPVTSPRPVPVPFRVAVAPSAIATPVRTTTPSATRVPMPVPVPTPVPVPLRQMAEATLSIRSEVSPLTPSQTLRGALETPAAPAPEAVPPQIPERQVADVTPQPVVPSPIETEAAPSKPVEPVQVAEATSTEPAPAPTAETATTQMAELAAQDRTALATPSAPRASSELNGSINLADATPNAAAETTAPMVAPVQMAALDPEAVAAAQRRQAEASAREAARLAEAQQIETARREAARAQAAATARALAERQAAERRAAQQLAEARAKEQKEKEAREQLAAERKAAQERAIAARDEERRQAEAARARNARGTAVVQVGAFKDKDDANAAISQFARFFPSFAQREVSTVTRRDGVWYRARFMGLGATAATEACRLVSGRGGACEVVGR